MSDTWITGNLFIGNPTWYRQIGIHDDAQGDQLFLDRWPKDGTVYVIGSLFSNSAMDMSEAERYLARLPGRKIFVYDPKHPIQAQFATLPGWYEAYETPTEVKTWGVPVMLSTTPVPEKLTFHIDDSVRDSGLAVNVSWESWGEGSYKNSDAWSGFVTPYYLYLYAQNVEEGFALPV